MTRVAALNRANGPDWYAIHFPQATAINCLEMTMECPNRDGGSWTSLWVEVWNTAAQTWDTAANLSITPPYNFANVPYNRRPYETYVLLFDEVVTTGVRLIEQAGGLAEFTSLAHIEVFCVLWMIPLMMIVSGWPTEESTLMNDWGQIVSWAWATANVHDRWSANE